MIVYLKLDDGRVAQAKYQTFGCGASIAAGSLLTEMIIGREIRECLALTSDALSDAMGGFPPDKLHCPILAVAALHDALKGMAIATA
jgi:nitrogen fixation NifU-like protein